MTDAERDHAELPVQFSCPDCKRKIQRTLDYLREYRILWCEHCGKPIIYDDLTKQAEKLLRRQALSPNGGEVTSGEEPGAKLRKPEP